MRDRFDHKAAPNASDAGVAMAMEANEPWHKPLRSTFWFLMAPASCLLLPWLLDIDLPPLMLYLIAGLAGAVMAARAVANPDWLLAVFIFYIPFNRIYVAPIGAGINATNILLVLLMFAWVARTIREGRPLFAGLPFSLLVGLWALLSISSVFTAMFTFNAGFITEDRLEAVKGWCDQFIVFFAILNLIRDGAMAKRVVVYMMIGTLIVVLFGYSEWQEKRFYESIERARLVGPQMQPNDFGAFLVYGVCMPLAVLVANLFRWQAWITIAPALYVLTRMLLATFSRGAVIGAGMVIAAVLLARGRVLFGAVALAGMFLLNAAPQLLPDSMVDRMAQTSNEHDESQLDNSSETRLILWKAAIAITMNNPIFGTGFGTFKVLKGQYTEVDVPESDNHNMFLYISSQMGIPALLVFLLIFVYTAFLGMRLHAKAQDGFTRTIGLGAVSVSAAVFGINMFGSRMVDLNVMAYVWITIAALSHLWAEHIQGSQVTESTSS
jgi:putative inorganic carbon (hco3(-)) transporter